METPRQITVDLVPGDIVYNVGLQQQVPPREQVLSDEVLVGPHSYTVTHTERAQDIQDLKAGARHYHHLYVSIMQFPMAKGIQNQEVFYEPNTLSGCRHFHHLPSCVVR